MADRSVTVNLRLDASQFTAGLARAAAAAKAFEKSLSDKTSGHLDDSADSADNVSHSLTGASRSAKGFTASMKSAAKATADADRKNRGFFASLDTSNDRFVMMTQSALALGPALVPIGAVAVPAIAALSAGLGFAVLGATSAALAFNGVGDALTAMNDVGLDPSAANLEKLQVAMDNIGPAARDFATYLNEVRPAMQELQNTAAAGMLPGVEEGIRAVSTQLPLLEGVVGSVSRAMGTLAADAGEALTSPFWTDFFAYLRDDAQVVMASFGRAIGNLGQTIAALAMDFGPMTRDIAAWLDESTASLAEWAKNLPDTQGFQEFIGYIRDIGPQVGDTLAALGNALVQIVEAAAPLGGPALMAIEGLSNAIAFIANSNAGPALLAIAGALAALSRAIAIKNLIGASSIAGAISSLSTAATRARSSVVGLTAPVQNLQGAMTSIATVSNPNAKSITGIQALGTAATRATRPVGLFSTAASKLKTAVGENARSAAGMAGLATAMVDIGDASTSSGRALSAFGNVATGALLGFSVGGGFGAAIGGFAGLLTSFGSDVEATTLSVQALGSTMSDVSGQFTDASAQMVAASITEQIDASDLDALGLSYSDLATAALEGGDAYSSLTSELESNIVASGQLEQGATHLSLSQIEASDSAERVLEAMSGVRGVVEDTQGAYDAAASASEAYGGGQSFLGSMIDNAAEAARAAIASHNALANVLLESRNAAVGYEAAIDEAWKEARNGARTLDITTEAGRKNQVALDAVAASWNNLSARAQNAPGAFRRARTEFVGIAQAMGASRAEAERLADKLLEIPRDVRAKVALEGAKNVQDAVRGLMGDLFEYGRQKPEARLTADEADALNAARRAMSALNVFSNQEPEVVLSGNEQDALNAAQNAMSALNLFDGQSPSATLNANDNASRDISWATQLAQSFAGTYTATLVVNRVGAAIDSLNPFGADGGQMRDGRFQRLANGGQPDPMRQGGELRGPGGPRDDLIPAMLSNKEFVVNAYSTQKHLQLLHAINADKMADGGRPGSRIKTPKPLSASDIVDKALAQDTPATIMELAKALRVLKEEAKDVAAAERVVRQEREEAKNLAKGTAGLEREQAKAQREADKRLAQLERSFGNKISKSEEARLKRAEKAAQQEQKRFEDRLKKRTRMQKRADNELEKAERSLAKQRDQLSEATAKWKAKQQELIAQAKAIADTVMSQGAIFGGQGTSVTVSGILAKLRASTQDAKAFQGYIQQLRGRGLDESLIQQLLEQGPTPEGVAAAKALAEASKKQLEEINQQQARLTAVAGQIGRLGIDPRTSAAVDNRVIVNLNGPITTTDVHRLARELPRHIRKAVRIAAQP